MPSPYAVGSVFRNGLKKIGNGWQSWSITESIDVSLALRPVVAFRDDLLSRAAQASRTLVTVSAAARILQMHRASVHRYLQRHPDIRNARGKVVLSRLVEVVDQAREKETRGRRSPICPKRPKLNGLPPHLRPFRSTLSEFYAWRKARGMGWLRITPQDLRDIADALAPVADFVTRVNNRAVWLLTNQHQNITQPQTHSR